MNKISYRSKQQEKKKPLNGQLPFAGSGDENFGSTESGGRNSIALPGLPDTHELPDDKMTVSDAVKAIRHLSDTADELDADRLESEADFVDYLIVKFAIAMKGGISEEERFVEYIYKIYSSDISGSVDKIKAASQIYSDSIIASLQSGESKETAKAKSFDTMISSFSSNSSPQSLPNKSAQFRESDPKYVAEEIAKIIKVINSKMSIESQNKARINIKNRVLKLVPQDMSIKGTPAGASIGTSIALIKNILNGRDGYFIRQVIDQLARLL